MKDYNLDELVNQIKQIENLINKGEDTSFVNDLDEFMEKLKPPSSFPKVDVKIKKLHPDAVIPSYSNDGDAGMDLVATQQIENIDDQVTFGTGLAMEIPYGYVGLIFPRSSIRNYGLTLSNSVGVIDSTYRGELRVVFNKSFGFNSLKYKVGDRIAQIIILPYPKINFVLSDELSETKRGIGGFGSTGL